MSNSLSHNLRDEKKADQQANNIIDREQANLQRGFNQLRDLIDQYFSLEEIQGLCYDLSIEYEHLVGSTRPSKVQSLITYLVQRQRLPELLHCLKEQRPFVDWTAVEQPSLPPVVTEMPSDISATQAYERPGRMTQYLDFEVEVGVGVGRDYPVAVIHSPAGESRETMRFPYDELALENRLQSLQIALLHAGGAHRQMLTPEEELVQEFGRDLFNALLTGEARSRFDVSCAEARQRGKGLRLKLRIQPPELARLPWEFLYDQRRAEYVCLSRETPIIRYLELPQPIQPLTVNPPLRILGMTVSPCGLSPLDIEQEKLRVDTAVRPLQANGMVRLTWLTGSTWRDLQRAMRAGPWHIFHFIGHGGFDSLVDEGFIALANENGDVHRLLATELGRLLADHHSLRLVLLNSCEGARGSQHDIFSSSAAILVRRGLPAVLAMQYAITDRAAIEFSRAFYEALTDNLPVDAAVAEARKAVSLAMSYTVEWGTPVLYMRAPQGIIFKINTAPRQALPELEVTDSEVDRRLEHLYTDGLGAYWVEDWDKACRSFQKILDIQPGYADTAVRLAEAQRQQKLHTLYQRAQEAGEDWSVAIAALEEIVVDMPHYKDAPALLAAARQQKQLADLYAEARRLHVAGQWPAVVKVFGQIRGIDVAYPDLDDLLATAEQKVAELQRQAELNRLYGRAVRHVDAGQWAEACQLLATIAEMEPDFRETKRLLARAEEAAARAAAEEQRQAQISTWYEQALSLARAGQWPQVLAKMAEITALDPQFADPEGLAERAQAELERVEAEAQRQQELAALYAEAVRLLKAQEYQAALEMWRQVQALDAHYPDRQKVQNTAKKKLKALSQPAAPLHRRPNRKWLWWGGGVMVAVTTVALILILINPFNWGEGENGLAGAGGTNVPATATRPAAAATVAGAGGTNVPATATRLAAAAVVAGECPTITAWKAEYWDNQQLRGDPVLCRNESFASHNWGTNSFRVGFPANNFSARFTRTVHFPAGNTRFTLGSDDGARLWVDDTLLIDRWRDGGYTETWADVYLSEGNHRLRLDYYENWGDAKVGLTWTAVATCAPGVIYCEDFEDGRADNWRLLESWGVGSKWEVLSHEAGSNWLYQGTYHRMSELQHEGWTDYRLCLRLRLIVGQIHLNYRHSASEGAFTRYFIGFSESGLSLSRQEGDTFSHPKRVDARYALNRWYDIEIVGEGGHIQVYVDGVLKLDYVDNDPILKGSISFETLDDSQAQIDDVEVLPITR